MRFSIATLSLAAFTVVNAGYISRGEGLTRGEKYERHECDFDSFEWKFGLAVKELKHHGDKNWGRDVEDLVYESDDGQLYHGCKDVYKASKCRNCYETFEFSDNESSDDEGSGSDCEDDECKKRRRKFIETTNVVVMVVNVDKVIVNLIVKDLNVATIHSVNFMKIIVICFLLYVMVFYMMIDMPLVKLLLIINSNLINHHKRCLT